MSRFAVCKYLLVSGEWKKKTINCFQIFQHWLKSDSKAIQGDHWYQGESVVRIPLDASIINNGSFFESSDQWSPPPNCLVKINIDGSTCHMGAIATIAQNHKEEFLRGQSKAFLKGWCWHS